ncbi:MAG: ATP-binding cassette domain-containing protein, partial [Polyangiaceae bacterium]
WATLELRGVIHAFRSEDGRPFSLGPIDLTFKPGEVVYVMGGNGSGKTTLIKLLLSLYTPEAGEILVDGRAVAAEDVAGYRERFAAVLADYRVFEELYGVASTTRDADARALLERLSLADRVQVREGAWSTRDLSEGQRARLALVAALLRDRSIYVFDEWAAHQDPEFKSVFYESILPELKARGKTVVAVTHDDRFAHLADRIVRLEEGKVLAR